MKRKKELTGMCSLIHWAYHHLMVHDEKGDIAALLQSSEGVRQGCVLGSLAFAVATLEMFTKIKQVHKDIELVAYLDDVTISGPIESAFRAFRELQEEAKGVGLFVQKEKCEVLTGLEAVDGLISRHMGFASRRELYRYWAQWSGLIASACCNSLRRRWDNGRRHSPFSPMRRFRLSWLSSLADG